MNNDKFHTYIPRKHKQYSSEHDMNIDSESSYEYVQNTEEWNEELEF